MSGKILEYPGMSQWKIRQARKRAALDAKQLHIRLYEQKVKSIKTVREALYFMRCRVCGSGRVIDIDVNGRNAVTCKNCGAHTAKAYLSYEKARQVFMTGTVGDTILKGDKL